MMKIVADTHVHFYPCYDLQAALRNLVDNLGNLGGNAVRTAFLVERSDCQYFTEIEQRKAGFSGGDFEISPAAEAGSMILSKNGRPELYLFAGRQTVTAEGVEILALTVDTRIADGLPAREVVGVILDAGGIPVLSWAPGKWFFRRGQIVRELIESFSPGELLIGDTTLRPTVWIEPLLMRLAVRRGFAVMAGSDPLPFSGEEKYMGTYASVLDGPFDPDKPVTSVRKMLTTPGMRIVMAGKRCGPLEVIRRLRRNTASYRK